MLIRSVDINRAIVRAIIENPSVFSNCHRCTAVSLQDMVACGMHIADFTVHHDGAVFCKDDIAVQLGAIRDFGAVFHFEGSGTIRTVDHAAAGELLNQCGGGQRSLRVVAQMNAIPLFACHIALLFAAMLLMAPPISTLPPSA